MSSIYLWNKSPKTYGYDENGNVNSIVDSLGGTNSMTYNDAGQLLMTSYENGSTQLRVDMTYDLAGNMLSATRYTDVAGTSLAGSSTYGYEGNEVTFIVHKNASGTTLASYSYSYNSSAQLTVEIDNGTTTSYGYTNGQLTSAGTLSYAYDPSGVLANSGDSTGVDNELSTNGTWNYSYLCRAKFWSHLLPN